MYSSRLHILQNKQLWLNEFTHLSSMLWLSAVCTHYYIGCMNILLLHTVSFDWFLSGLEWILNLEVSLLQLLIFYQKLLWNIKSRFNSSTYWVFRSMFDQNWRFVNKKWRFWSNIFKYSLKNSKCGRVKPRSDIP